MRKTWKGRQSDDSKARISVVLQKIDGEGASQRSCASTTAAISTRDDKVAFIAAESTEGENVQRVWNAAKTRRKATMN